MKEKTVEFTDKQGKKIVGDLIIPEGKGPFPAVIVCHGFKGTRNQTHIKAIAEELFKVGIATLRFDFVKDPGESSLAFEEMTISYELEVLENAFNYFKGLEEVDASRIGITGHSLGGLVASWFAATHPEIKSLVTLSAVYSFGASFESHYPEYIKEAKEKGYGYVYSQTTHRSLKLNQKFYEEGLTYSMDKMIENINCPVMVLCGTADKLLGHSQNYFDRLAISQKELKIVKESDHNYSNPIHLNDVIVAVAEWFAKSL